MGNETSYGDGLNDFEKLYYRNMKETDIISIINKNVEILYIFLFERDSVTF